tara:strand:- start:603 stop:1343 length:741 start_codon:yes stop_codon:yes gene_type:complete
MWNSEHRINLIYRAQRNKAKIEYEHTVDLYASGKGPGNGGNIMLLAMHYAPEARNIESDTNRINAFLEGGWNVCSVDLSGHKNDYGHISANFTTPRGIKGIINSITENAQNEPQIIALDYFWLQNPIYYKERYGEDWPLKSQLFFEAFKDLTAIILPIDNWEPSSMEQQMKELKAPLSYFKIGKDNENSNPLVRYTLRSNDQDPKFSFDRSHAAQKWRIRGFVVVHRSSMPRREVEAYLSRSGTII